jgi:fructosamine-3-kinase
MNPRLLASVQKAIEEATGRPSQIVAEHPVSGGCINEARRIDLSDGRRYFLKTNAHQLPGLFGCEAAGLNALRAAGALRVPMPIAHHDDTPDAPGFLVLEYVDSAGQGRRFQENLGHGLANLHRGTHAPRFGFQEDNYLGNTPQMNGWLEDWVEFWRVRRLGFQLELVRRNGIGDSEFSRLGDRLMDRLEEYLATPDEPPCLLHGDLWGGNVLADERGNPVLIDPAAYYGRREADLAMTMLFGGFSARFYAAYEETFPLAPGSEVRLDLYKLYHLLNHLNLFGAGYQAGCLAIMQRYG